jgi:hypothetical protein
MPRKWHKPLFLGLWNSISQSSVFSWTSSPGARRKSIWLQRGSTSIRSSWLLGLTTQKLITTTAHLFTHPSYFNCNTSPWDDENAAFYPLEKQGGARISSTLELLSTFIHWACAWIRRDAGCRLQVGSSLTSCPQELG